MPNDHKIGVRQVGVVVGRRTTRANDLVDDGSATPSVLDFHEEGCDFVTDLFVVVPRHNSIAIASHQIYADLSH